MPFLTTGKNRRGTKLSWTMEENAVMKKIFLHVLSGKKIPVNVSDIRKAQAHPCLSHRSLAQIRTKVSNMKLKDERKK